MTRAICVLLSAALAGAAPADDAPRRALSADDALSAMNRGVEFLLNDQNTDGSWGGPRGAVSTFSGIVWSNPETHHAWKVATTGLCCMALLEAGQDDQARAAADRAVDYLIKNADTKRPSEWDTMNSWAYIYGVQALARAYVEPRYANTPRREQCRDAAEPLLRRLAACQALNGGWGYLEFDVPRTSHQQWATSFMSAAGVIALLDAREAGFDVDQGVIERAVKAVDHCRLPNGAFTYAVDVVPSPRNSEYINQVKGSLGRIPCCNLALRMGGRDVPVQRFRTGLEQLFRWHRFLDIARNKPIPHETFYYNSGYFYMFGHYYAARSVMELPKSEREKYWPRLRYEVAKIQQSDGSMYDYDMHAYHKPYGTAFGVMALHESVAEQED
jgi:hypothetical protein